MLRNTVEAQYVKNTLRRIVYLRIVVNQEQTAKLKVEMLRFLDVL